jgi:hypothetical protein
VLRDLPKVTQLLTGDPGFRAPFQNQVQSNAKLEDSSKPAQISVIEARLECYFSVVIFIL